MALVLIPQSMAYAQLAGLPAYYGLYASFLPPMMAALFGSSRQLATGPVAVVSLMTSASLEPLATAGSEGYIAYAILLALMVGVFQLALGVLRLGLVVNFLSHPVVNGFTNAAAIIIATSQLSKMFGVYVDSAAAPLRNHHARVSRRPSTTPTGRRCSWARLAFAIMYGLEADEPQNSQRAGGGGRDHHHFLGHRFRARRHGRPCTPSQSPEAAELIAEFNAAIKRHPALWPRSAPQLAKRWKRPKAQDDILAMLDAEHERRTCSALKMDWLKREAHLVRDEIRERCS